MRRETMVNAAAYKELMLVLDEKEVKKETMEMYENTEDKSTLSSFVIKNKIFSKCKTDEYKEKAKKLLNEYDEKLLSMINNPKTISNEVGAKLIEDITITTDNKTITITCNGATFTIDYPTTLLEYDKVFTTLNTYFAFIEKHDNIFELSKDVQKVFEEGSLIDLHDEPGSIH